MENARDTGEDELRRLRQRLVELEARQDQLIRIVDEETLGLAYVDTELRVVDISETFASSFGIARAWTPGETLQSLLPSLAETAEEAMQLVLSTGRPIEEELIWPPSPAASDGSRAVRLSYEPWRSHSGEMQGVSVLARSTQFSPTSGHPEIDLGDLLTLLPHGVQVYDLAGIITYSNPAHARMHGKLDGELVGLPIWELVEPKSQRALKEYLFHLIEHQPEPTVFEAISQRPDGTNFSQQVDWDYLRDASGKLSGFVSVITDTTERKKMLAELELSEKRLRNAQALAKVGSWEWHVSEDTMLWSEELCRIMGLPCQEPRTTDYASFVELVHPDDRVKMRRRLEEAIETSSSFQMEYRLIRPSGEVVYVHALGAVVQDDHGRVRTVQGTAQDTSLFRLAESQRRLLRELDHRVKNNLSTILGLLQLSQASHETFDDFLESFQARVFVMAQLHEDLAARSWTQLPLTAVVKKAVGHLFSHCRLDGPELELSARIAIPLGLAIHELSTNALNHGGLTEKGGAVEIAWTLDSESEEVSLSWAEVGGGPVPKNAQEGTGLSLLRTLVEHEIGGEVDLSFSEGGVRHRFSFSRGDSCEFS